MADQTHERLCAFYADSYVETLRQELLRTISERDALHEALCATLVAHGMSYTRARKRVREILAKVEVDEL